MQATDGPWVAESIVLSWLYSDGCHNIPKCVILLLSAFSILGAKNVLMKDPEKQFPFLALLPVGLPSFVLCL